jgi:hypothetical protein
MTLPTDRLPNLDEVAAHVGITPRAARRIIRKHGVPVLDTGRTIAFDDLAMNLFMEALRCRSKLYSEPTVPADGSRLRARSSSLTGRRSLSAEVQARITSSLRERKRQRSKPTSSDQPGTANVVAPDFTRKLSTSS